MLWMRNILDFTLLVVFLAGHLHFSKETDSLDATPGKCPINLVIALDMSSSTCSSDVNFERNIIEGISKLIESIGNNSETKGSQVAALLFNTNIVETVDWGQHGDLEKFLYEIRRLLQGCFGGTNVQDGMMQAINYFKEHDSPVTDARKVMLVITDGQDQSDVQKARLIANQQAITVYAAGYGKYDDDLQYLQLIAGDPERLLDLKNLTEILYHCYVPPETMKNVKQIEEATSAEPITDANEKIQGYSATPSAVAGTAQPKVQNAPRRCACNLRGAWLDIVLVIDSSKAVSRQDLVALTQGIGSLVRLMSVGPKNGKYSRIAIVKISEVAERVADLSSFVNSTEAAKAIKNLVQGVRKNDTSEYEHDETVNIAAGLLEAQNILRDRRPNVKGLVILFSSRDVPCHTNSYRMRKRSVMEDEDPCRVAERIKNERNVLATVAMKFGKVKTYPSLNISSPCYGINSDLKFLSNIKKLICHANCFCLDPYIQFKDNDNCELYGECIYLQSISNDYHAASDTCGAYNSTLVDISSKSKDNFIRKLHGGAQLTPYWIGLSSESGRSVWNSGTKLLPNDYMNWAPGNPNESLGKCTYVDVQNFTTMWKSEDCDSLEGSKFFSCQKMSCDTDNYCDFSI